MSEPRSPQGESDQPVGWPGGGGWAPHGAPLPHPPHGTPAAPPQGLPPYTPPYGTPAPPGQPGYGPPPQPGPFGPAGPPPQVPPAGPGMPGPVAGAGVGGPPYPGQPWQPDGIIPAGPARRTRRWLTVGVAASIVAVLGIAGGAYAVFGRHSTTDPAHFVPDDVVAMLSVDLDPPTDQKVAALRFLTTFPPLDKHRGSDNLIDGVVRAALEGTPGLDRFDQHIRPWLGTHVGIAADPQGDRVHPLLVVEATDRDKALSGLQELSKGADDIGYTVRDNYVFVSDSTEAARRAAADSKDAPLDDNDQYRHDIDALDEERVATAWVDLKRIVDEAPDFGGTGVPSSLLSGLEKQVKGRVAIQLRFGANHGEVMAKFFDGTVTPNRNRKLGDSINNLPSNSALVVGLTGLDQTLPQIFEILRDSGLDGPLQDLQDTTGLSLPDDLSDLLRGSAVLTANDDLSAFGLLTSADLETAQQTADKLASAFGGNGPDLTVKAAGGRSVIATDEDYAATLAGGGELGEQELFRTAVPDAANAAGVVYVDVQQIIEAAGREVPPAAKSVRAVGLTASWDTLRLRVVLR